MGLIAVAKDSLGSVLADQWREYFYCDSIPNDTLVVKAQNKNKKNNHGTDNIISNGSVVVVNEGQCMIIVDQGEIVDFSALPGEYTYDQSTEPSLFYGSLKESIVGTFKNIGKRFSFGGEPGKDQRVYYFNTKEIMDNLYGTNTPVPFRIVDNKIGLDLDTNMRCHGTYTFKISDPLLFYKNVCGNITEPYKKDQILNQMKSEFVTALAPALGKISAKEVRPSDLPNHCLELAEYLNEALSAKWIGKRGIEIVEVTMDPPTIPPETLKEIQEIQKRATLTNPMMAGAMMTEATAEAMKMAAGNTATGPMFAFAGMNMAQQAGGGLNAANFYQMGMQQQAQQQAAAPQMAAPSQAVAGWTCSCGQGDNKGKFCMGCGAPKPAEAGWTCSCGTVNQGKFCQNCGSKKPEGAPIYKCDKCGFEPEDPAHPPKFCPECGDIFDDNDIQK